MQACFIITCIWYAFLNQISALSIAKWSWPAWHSYPFTKMTFFPSGITERNIVEEYLLLGKYSLKRTFSLWVCLTSLSISANLLIQEHYSVEYVDLYFEKCVVTDLQSASGVTVGLLLLTMTTICYFCEGVLLKIFLQVHNHWNNVSIAYENYFCYILKWRN